MTLPNIDSRRLSRIKLSLAVFFSSLTCACAAGGSLGEIEPIVPLIEARYLADASARSIHDQFSEDTPEYAIGQLLYNNAYTSVNTVIQQIITTLQAQGELPNLNRDNSGNSLQSDENRASKITILEDFKRNIDIAIKDSRKLSDFVKEEICQKEDENNMTDSNYSVLCNKLKLIPSNQRIDARFFPSPDTVLNAINQNILQAQILRDGRRKELVEQYKSVLLLPFNELDPESKSSNSQ